MPTFSLLVDDEHLVKMDFHNVSFFLGPRSLPLMQRLHQLRRLARPNFSSPLPSFTLLASQFLHHARLDLRHACVLCICECFLGFKTPLILVRLIELIERQSIDIPEQRTYVPTSASWTALCARPKVSSDSSSLRRGATDSRRASCAVDPLSVHSV